MKTVVSRRCSAAEKRQLEKWDAIKDWSVPEEPICVISGDSLSLNVQLGSIEGHDPTRDIWRGKPVKNWPKKVVFPVDPIREFKSKTEYADLLVNPSDVLVISARFREFLEHQSIKGVDFLPITILDRSCKAVEPTYWLAHVTKVIDCIDQKKSSLEWNPLDKESLLFVKKLIIDEKKVPSTVRLFCLRHLRGAFFVRRDLALAIREAQLTGALFWPISSWVQ